MTGKNARASQMQEEFAFLAAHLPEPQGRMGADSHPIWMRLSLERVSFSSAYVQKEIGSL